MLSDSRSSIQHIEALLALARRLSEWDVAIYEHRYQSLIFGSWIIVAGKRKELVRFCWDGRDGFMTVEQAVVANSRQQLSWEHVKTYGINTTRYMDTLESIEDFLKTKFAV